MLNKFKSKFMYLITLINMSLMNIVYADTVIDLPINDTVNFNRVVKGANRAKFLSSFQKLMSILTSFIDFLILFGVLICVGGLIYTAVLFSTTDNVAEHMRAKKNLGVVLVCTAGIGGFRIILQLVLALMSM